MRSSVSPTPILLLLSFFFSLLLTPLQTLAADPQSLDTIRASAEQGFAEAQNELGLAYHNGQSVPQDYRQAVLWFTKAAEQGYAAAQYNIGFAYYTGQGVPQDYRQAVLWYTKAAQQGRTDAHTTSG